MTASSSASVERQQLVRLFLVSFAALALEVMLIRWVASEIRIFAYLKNLVLMACLLGMGSGCASPMIAKNAGQKRIPGPAFPILLTIIVAIVATAMKTGVYDISLLVDPNLFDFNVGVTSVATLGFNVTCVCIIFIVMMATFDFLGLELGYQLYGLPPLKAYSVNLLGSLAGVISLSVISYLQLPPPVWLLVSLLPLAAIYFSDKKSAVIFSVCGVICTGLTIMSVGSSLWSPYYRLDQEPLTYYLKDNSQISVPYELGTVINTNHIHHQRAMNFTPEMLSKHPELKTSNEYVTYGLPYHAVEHPKHVLILGSGTGNDVSAAIRYNADNIDAVEIDPVILQIGKKIHPEKPYENSKVTIHQDDARAFLAKDPNKYDLIQFGYLDSQTALSTMSSVRLDNYLYTKESLAAATAHLAPDGVACLSFATQLDWMRARLYQLVKAVWPGEPLAIDTHYGSPRALMIMWGPGLDAVRDKIVTAYPNLIATPQELTAMRVPVEISTDDWPFLYQHSRDIPVISLVILAFVVIMSTIVVTSRFRLRPKTFAGNLQFFLLGAGFLLMETRAMLSIAILFSSTWIVNSVVIALVLLMALFSTWFVMKTKILTQVQAYILLFIALIVMFAVPIGSLVAYPIAVKLLVACLVLGAPFFFSGVVFARAFAQTKNPEIALGVNILGSILGGCIEYLSVVIGINGLTLLALGVYLLSMAASKLIKAEEPS